MSETRHSKIKIFVTSKRFLSEFTKSLEKLKNKRGQSSTMCNRVTEYTMDIMYLSKKAYSEIGKPKMDALKEIKNKTEQISSIIDILFLNKSLKRKVCAKLLHIVGDMENQASRWEASLSRKFASQQEEKSETLDKTGTLSMPPVVHDNPQPFICDGLF